MKIVFPLNAFSQRRLLDIIENALKAEAKGHAELLAKIESAKQEILAELKVQRADAELLAAAREAKAVIDETTTALNVFTPES